MYSPLCTHRVKRQEKAQNLISIAHEDPRFFLHSFKEKIVVRLSVMGFGGSHFRSVFHAVILWCIFSMGALENEWLDYSGCFPKMRGYKLVDASPRGIKIILLILIVTYPCEHRVMSASITT